MSRHADTRVRAVDRALDVLDLLRDAGPEGARVTDMARALGVDAATVSRVLATLAARGYACRLANRRYTLGPSLARLPLRWTDGVLERAGPRLGALTQATGETIYLLELLGGEAATIATMRPSRRPGLDCERGPTFPLWATAAGHALLAPLPATERLRVLPPEPYPAFTASTPARWSQLAAMLRHGAAAGVFSERACYAPGVECLAASVAPPGGGLLALAMSFPSSHRRGERRRGDTSRRRSRPSPRTDLERRRLGLLLREAASELAQPL